MQNTRSRHGEEQIEHVRAKGVKVCTRDSTEEPREDKWKLKVLGVDEMPFQAACLLTWMVGLRECFLRVLSVGFQICQKSNLETVIQRLSLDCQEIHAEKYKEKEEGKGGEHKHTGTCSFFPGVEYIAGG